MDYRVWAIIGIVLLIAELSLPSFFLVFFGIGGLLTALAAGLGWVTGTTGQLALFSFSALGLMLLFRSRVRFGAPGSALPPDFIGQHVKVTKTILPGGEGQVSYRGSPWVAFSEQPEAEIPEGSLVEIVGNDGLRLKVKKIV